MLARTRRLPELSMFYPGLTPPVIDQMTHAEVVQYVTEMDRTKAAQRVQVDI